MTKLVFFYAVLGFIGVGYPEWFGLDLLWREVLTLLYRINPEIAMTVALHWDELTSSGAVATTAFLGGLAHLMLRTYYLPLLQRRRYARWEARKRRMGVDGGFV